MIREIFKGCNEDNYLEKTKERSFLMETEGKGALTHHAKRLVTLFVVMIMLMCALSMNVFAASGKMEVAGTVYEFDKDRRYEFDECSSSEKTGSNNTYGTFYISGNVSDVNEESGVPAYEVSDGNLTFYYNYGDAVLNAGEDEWHLVDDKSKKVDDMKLSSDIMKGAIIIQTSKDRKNWVDVDTICNAFDDTPARLQSGDSGAGGQGKKEAE